MDLSKKAERLLKLAEMERQQAAYEARWCHVHAKIYQLRAVFFEMVAEGYDPAAAWEICDRALKKAVAVAVLRSIYQSHAPRYDVKAMTEPLAHARTLAEIIAGGGGSRA